MRTERPVPDPFHFWKTYSLLNSSAFITPPEPGDKLFCRFCKRDASSTRLTEDTHLIPELLGSNQILSSAECDECNRIFSDYETHLSDFIRPFITILGIKGKHKVPTFQSRSINGDPYSVTSLVYAARGERKLYVGEESDVTIDMENHTMSILFRYPPYVPVKIYKALVKIGMSLLPKEFDTHCTHIYKWLLSKDNEISYITRGFMTSMTGAYWESPSAELYQANHLHTKTEEFPEYTLIVRFANQVLQIFLPFTELIAGKTGKNRSLIIELFPPIPYTHLGLTQRSYTIIPFDFSCNSTVKDNRRVNFKFGEIELIKPESMIV